MEEIELFSAKFIIFVKERGRFNFVLCLNILFWRWVDSDEFREEILIIPLLAASVATRKNNESFILSE